MTPDELHLNGTNIVPLFCASLLVFPNVGLKRPLVLFLYHYHWIRSFVLILDFRRPVTHMLTFLIKRYFFKTYACFFFCFFFLHCYYTKKLTGYTCRRNGANH